MATEKWLKEMVTVWVSRETRDKINLLRVTQKIKTADDVLEKYLPKTEAKRKQT